MDRLHPTGTLDKSFVTMVYLRNAAVVTPHFLLAPKKKAPDTLDGETVPTSKIWSGYGGRWQDGDKTIYATAQRELHRKSGVRILQKNLVLCGRVEFFWLGNTAKKRDVEVFFFTAHKYSAEPVVSDEMGLSELFTAYTAPYLQMMPADKVILPLLMSDRIVQGQVVFSKNDKDEVVASYKKLHDSPRTLYF